MKLWAERVPGTETADWWNYELKWDSPCCGEMEQLLQPYPGYGPYLGVQGQLCAEEDLTPPIQFCPWCGRKVERGGLWYPPTGQCEGG